MAAVYVAIDPRRPEAGRKIGSTGGDPIRRIKGMLPYGLLECAWFREFDTKEEAMRVEMWAHSIMVRSCCRIILNEWYDASVLTCRRAVERGLVVSHLGTPSVWMPKVDAFWRSPSYETDADALAAIQAAGVKITYMQLRHALGASGRSRIKSAKK